MSFTENRFDGSDGFRKRHEGGGSGFAFTDFHAALFERTRAHDDPHGASDQVGVLELDSGTFVAIINEDVDAVRLQFALKRFGGLSAIFVLRGVKREQHDLKR